jgi:hypothetical protein
VTDSQTGAPTRQVLLNFDLKQLQAQGIDPLIVQHSDNRRSGGRLEQIDIKYA